jgi:acyl-CoA thioester hydrolase
MERCGEEFVMTKGAVDMEVRVRYAETDKMGVAYYANYFVWFEVGRAELCRKKGFSYADLEALGYILVVTDAHCHYRNSARYDETIIIRTRLKGINKRMITFGYQLLRNGSEEELAEGETRHLSIGPNGKPKSLPDKFVDLLSS